MSQEQSSLLARVQKLFRREVQPPPKPIKKETVIPERNTFEYSVHPIPLERAFIRPEIDSAVQILQDPANTDHSITVLAPPRSGGSSFANQVAEKLIEKDNALIITKQLFFARQLTGDNFESTFQQELTDSHINPSDHVCIILEEIESYGPQMKHTIISRLNSYVHDHPGSFLIILSRKDIPESEKDIFPQPKVLLNLLDEDSMKKFLRSKMGDAATPKIEDYIVTQTGGHLATAQKIGLAIYDFIRSTPNCSPEELELFLRSEINNIFGTLFAPIFQQRAGDPNLIQDWLKRYEGLSEFDKNRFPRPTATLFKQWVQENIKA